MKNKISVLLVLILAFALCLTGCISNKPYMTAETLYKTYSEDVEELVKQAKQRDILVIEDNVVTHGEELLDEFINAIPTRLTGGGMYHTDELILDVVIVMDTEKYQDEIGESDEKDHWFYASVPDDIVEWHEKVTMSQALGVYGTPCILWDYRSNEGDKYAVQVFRMTYTNDGDFVLTSHIRTRYDVIIKSKSDVKLTKRTNTVTGVDGISKCECLVFEAEDGTLDMPILVYCK